MNNSYFIKCFGVHQHTATKFCRKGSYFSVIATICTHTHYGPCMAISVMVFFNLTEHHVKSDNFYLQQDISDLEFSTGYPKNVNKFEKQ